MHSKIAERFATILVKTILSFLLLMFSSHGLFSQAHAQALYPSLESKITFPKKQILISGKKITVELADNDQRRERGLMFREKLPENQGMLFIFEQERPLAFWMKNTLIPLSIGYFNSGKELIEVHEMVPAVMGEAAPKTYPSSRPAMYALEMPKGWFDRNKVKAGTKFKFADSGK